MHVLTQRPEHPCHSYLGSTHSSNKRSGTATCQGFRAEDHKENSLLLWNFCAGPVTSAAQVQDTAVERMADSSDGSVSASSAPDDTHDEESEEEPHDPSVTEVRSQM
jgi:hypothetical protein